LSGHVAPSPPPGDSLYAPMERHTCEHSYSVPAVQCPPPYTRPLLSLSRTKKSRRARNGRRRLFPWSVDRRGDL